MSSSNLSKGLEMYKWIKATQPYHLTLKDIQNWKKGEKHAVAMFALLSFA